MALIVVRFPGSTTYTKNNTFVLMVGLKSYYLRSPVHLHPPLQRPAHNGRPLSPARYLGAAGAPAFVWGARAGCYYATLHPC